MPYIVNERPTRKVKLPSNREYFVEIYTQATWGQAKQFTVINEDGDVDLVRTADSKLLAFIKDWNLDDAEGNKLPISQESIDMLNDQDATFLVNETSRAMPATDSKKNES
jgi:hypothetical protein